MIHNAPHILTASVLLCMLLAVIVASLWIVFLHAGKVKKSNMNKGNKNGKL
jgi:hypothetical protein